MRESECIEFLQWALPRLELRWSGFRKVRRQVCRRLGKRLCVLGLAELASYRQYLASEPSEWQILDRLCRVTISRFFRDRGVWQNLARAVLPSLAEQALARGAPGIRAWSAGCASGEEPYSLAILWRRDLAARYPGLALSIVATDADLTLLARARRGVYPSGSLREAAPLGLESAFEPLAEGDFSVRQAGRRGVGFTAMDLKGPPPAAKFGLVLCRNLAFTYYRAELQLRVLETIRSRLESPGFLVIGSHERLPDGADDFLATAPGVFEAPGTIGDRLTD